MTILNRVNHGITLSESSPSHTYSYSVSPTTENEPLTVPSLNGVYTTAGGQRVYLTPQRVQEQYLPLDMISASITDINGDVWSLFQRWQEPYYHLILSYNGSESDYTMGSSPCPFTLLVLNSYDITYDVESNKYTVRVGIAHYDQNGSFTSGYLSLGSYYCDAEVAALPLPQAKRTFAVTES
jgi:hypothetical protein